MRKMTRFVMATLLAVCLVFNCFAFAGSATVNTHGEYMARIESLMKQREDAILQGDLETADRIWQELQRYGGRELTPSEIAQKFTDSDTVSPMFDLPPTGAIRWTSFPLVVENPDDGLQYSVEIVYAEANANDCILVDVANRDIVTRDTSAIMSDTVMKTIADLGSNVPIAGDLLTLLDIFERAQSIFEGFQTVYIQASDESNEGYRIRSFTTVKFAFVKRYGTADDQELCYVATKVRTQVFMHFLVFGYNEYGQYTSEVITDDIEISKQASKYSMGYADIARAYADEQNIRSYVQYIIFKSALGSTDRTVYRLDPIRPDGVTPLL